MVKRPDPDLYLTLACVTSRTRMRLHQRGLKVESPAGHAARIVRLLEQAIEVQR